MCEEESQIHVRSRSCCLSVMKGVQGTRTMKTYLLLALVGLAGCSANTALESTSSNLDQTAGLELRDGELSLKIGFTFRPAAVGDAALKTIHVARGDKSFDS